MNILTMVLTIHMANTENVICFDTSNSNRFDPDRTDDAKQILTEIKKSGGE